MLRHDPHRLLPGGARAYPDDGGLLPISLVAKALNVSVATVMEVVRQNSEGRFTVYALWWDDGKYAGGDPMFIAACCGQ